MKIKNTLFRKNLFKKITALITATLFLSMELFSQAPSAFASSQSIKIQEETSSNLHHLARELVREAHHTERSQSAEIRIPSELGEIDEVYFPSTVYGVQSTVNGVKEKRLTPYAVPHTIVYIQDAHDSLEAQENIAKIIDHLVANYGVKTVFEEGYEGPVPTDEYFNFIADPKVKEKVSYFLMDHLRLGGAEYAHINRSSKRMFDRKYESLNSKHETNSNNKNFKTQNKNVSNLEHSDLKFVSDFEFRNSDLRDGDWNLIGADSIKLHLENIAQYRKSAKQKKQIDSDLAALEKEIKSLADQNFPKELKDWIKQKELFNQNKLPLMDYLKRLVELSRRRDNWEKQQDEDTLEITHHVPLQNRGDTFPPKDGSLPRRQAGAFGGEKLLSVPVFIKALLAKDEKAAQNIEPKQLFTEMAQLEKEIVRQYLKTARDQKIFEYYQTIQLLERLNDLSLSFPEYQAFIDHRPPSAVHSQSSSLRAPKGRGNLVMDTQGIGEFIHAQTGKTIILSKRWEQTIKDAVRFYEIAGKRDRAISDMLDKYWIHGTQIRNPKSETLNKFKTLNLNIQNKTGMNFENLNLDIVSDFEFSHSKLAVLIYGGFHKKNIKRMLKEKNISYVVVSPKITRESKRHQDFYKQLMTKGRHAFELPLNLSLAARAQTAFEIGNTNPLPVQTELRILSDAALQNPDLDTQTLILNMRHALEAASLNLGGGSKAEVENKNPSSFELQPSGFPVRSELPLTRTELRTIPDELPIAVRSELRSADDSDLRVSFPLTPEFIQSLHPKRLNNNKETTLALKTALQETLKRDGQEIVSFEGDATQQIKEQSYTFKLGRLAITFFMTTKRHRYIYSISNEEGVIGHGGFTYHPFRETVSFRYSIHPEFRGAHYGKEALALFMAAGTGFFGGENLQKFEWNATKMDFFQNLSDPNNIDGFLSRAGFKTGLFSTRYAFAMRPWHFSPRKFAAKIRQELSPASQEPQETRLEFKSLLWNIFRILSIGYGVLASLFLATGGFFIYQLNTALNAAEKDFWAHSLGMLIISAFFVSIGYWILAVPLGILGDGQGKEKPVPEPIKPEAAPSASEPVHEEPVLVDRHELREKDPLEKILPEEIILTDRDLKRVLSDEAITQLKEKGIQLVLRKLYPGKDQHFLTDWKKERQQIEVIPGSGLSQRDFNQLPWFPRLQYPHNFGIVFRKNGQEHLEGYIALDSSWERYDYTNGHFVYKLHIPNMETYFRHIGPQGEIKGIADLVFEFILKFYVENPEFFDGAIDLQAQTPGSKKFARRFGFMEGKDNERILKSPAIRSLYDERGLKEKFNSSRAELRNRIAEDVEKRGEVHARQSLLSHPKFKDAIRDMIDSNWTKSKRNGKVYFRQNLTWSALAKKINERFWQEHLKGEYSPTSDFELKAYGKAKSVAGRSKYAKRLKKEDPESYKFYRELAEYYGLTTKPDSRAEMRKNTVKQLDALYAAAREDIQRYHFKRLEKGIFIPSDLGLVHKILKYVKRINPEAKTFYEFGSGDGRVSLLAASQGWTAEGVEFEPGLAAISSRLKEQAVNMGLVNQDSVKFSQGDALAQNFSAYDVIFVTDSAGFDHNAFQDKVNQEAKENALIVMYHPKQPLDKLILLKPSFWLKPSWFGEFEGQAAIYRPIPLGDIQGKEINLLRGELRMNLTAEQAWTEFHQLYADSFGGQYRQMFEEFWQPYFASLPRNGKILDLGSGALFVANAAKKARSDAEVWGLDFAEIPSARIPKNIQFIRSPAEDMDQTVLPDNLDLVISQFGIEYMDWAVVLKKLARKMKPGGKALFLTHYEDSSLIRKAKIDLEQVKIIKDQGLLEKALEFFRAPSSPEAFVTDSRANALVLAFMEVAKTYQREVTGSQRGSDYVNVLRSVIEEVQRITRKYENGQFTSTDLKRFEDFARQFERMELLLRERARAALDGSSFDRFIAAAKAAGFEVESPQIKSPTIALAGRLIELELPRLEMRSQPVQPQIGKAVLVMEQEKIDGMQPADFENFLILLGTRHELQLVIPDAIQGKYSERVQALRSVAEISFHLPEIAGVPVFGFSNMAEDTAAALKARLAKSDPAMAERIKEYFTLDGIKGIALALLVSPEELQVKNGLRYDATGRFNPAVTTLFENLNQNYVAIYTAA